jgi:acyl-CoA thioesterase-1
MRNASALIVMALLVSACNREPAPPPTASLKVEAGPATEPAGIITKPRIVFLGDSLTAGLGLPSDQSYPMLIGKKLNQKGHDFEIVNAGVSGDTSAGGSRRLDWSLEGDVRALVLALGANDGLRGLPTDEMKKNLKLILDRATSRNIPVVLAGMEAPPNNGPEYTRAFRQVYTDLAEEYDVRFVPFLLLGVAGNPSLNQGDGIHPNARGAEIVADLVLAELEAVLRRSASAKAPARQAPSNK